MIVMTCRIARKKGSELWDLNFYSNVLTIKFTPFIINIQILSQDLMNLMKPAHKGGVHMLLAM